MSEKASAAAMNNRRAVVDNLNKVTADLSSVTTALRAAGLSDTIRLMSSATSFLGSVKADVISFGEYVKEEEDDE